MSKFRKKPIEIEAFQLGVDNLPDWFMDAVTKNEVILQNDHPSGKGLDTVWALIKTLEGMMEADNKDYIIKGIKGEIYPCKPDIFEASYDAVVDDEPKSRIDYVLKHCNPYRWTKEAIIATKCPQSYFNGLSIPTCKGTKCDTCWHKKLTAGDLEVKCNE